MRLTGESGDEEGDGSERGEESAVESVVVGEESADSEACVEVLSWCLCIASGGMTPGRRVCCSMCVGFDRGAQAGSTVMNFGSTTVTVSLSAMVSASKSKTDMKEGIWSSKYLRAAADGMFPCAGRRCRRGRVTRRGTVLELSLAMEGSLRVREEGGKVWKVIDKRQPVKRWSDVSSRLEPEGRLYYENAERSNYTQMVGIKKRSNGVVRWNNGEQKKASTAFGRLITTMCADSAAES